MLTDPKLSEEHRTGEVSVITKATAAKAGDSTISKVAAIRTSKTRLGTNETLPTPRGTPSAVANVPRL